MRGVNSSTIADIVLLSIGLPNGVLIPDIRVIVSPLGGQEDMLIGMDIIRLGDFSISNANNETLFSFAIPPFPEKIDLAEKSEAENRKTDGREKSRPNGTTLIKPRFEHTGGYTINSNHLTNL
ncbi:MAG: hypothetical protein LBQ61_08080 [Spirochaetales bacterium]|nr:hypothetical protein [Spirochaetales bacterium]